MPRIFPFSGVSRSRSTFSSGALAQVGNAHGDKGQDQKRNDEFEEGSENARGSDEGAADPQRGITADQNTEDDGEDELWHEADFHVFHLSLLLFFICAT